MKRASSSFWRRALQAKVVGLGALVLVMGLSAAVVLAFASPSPAPSGVNARTGVAPESAPATGTTTNTQPSTPGSSNSTTSPLPPATPTPKPTPTPTSNSSGVAAVSNTGATGSPQSPPAADSAALPTVTIGSWTGVKPQTIDFSGDAGNIVGDIVWTSWGGSTAVGTGRWGYDDCVPNCAQGTVTNYEAIITVSNPSGGQYTQLTEQQTGPHGQTNVFTLPAPATTIPGASSGSDSSQ